jgi:methyl-accepting chemotaxis protein
MPNGKSLLSSAQEMTLTVGKKLYEIKGSIEEFIKHLEARKAYLESLLDGSHQDDVAAMIAEIESAIAALKQAMEQIDEAAQQASKIEART